MVCRVYFSSLMDDKRKGFQTRFSRIELNMKRKPNDPSPEPFSLFLPFSPPEYSLKFYTHRGCYFFERNPIPTNQSFRHAGIKFLYPGNIVPFSYFLLYIPRDQCFPLRGEGRDKYARTRIHASGAFPSRFLSSFSLTRASIYSRILNPLVLPPCLFPCLGPRERRNAGGR